MDPEFNEKCADNAAEAWGKSVYRYSLMVKDGWYQWRWQIPLPPDCRGNPAVSPVYKTIEDAAEWALSNHTPRESKPDPNDGWAPVA